MTSILWLMTAISVSVGVCRYILGAILRITHPNCGVRQDFSFAPDISVLVPAYNEGETVYSTIASIMESEYAGNIEVIVTDDCSKDSTPDFIRKAARDFPNVQAVFNQKNLGKTQTLLNALAKSTRELVLIVDSDTVLGKDCIRQLAACFGDPRIGGAGAPAIVRNPNENAITVYQTVIYVLGFCLYKQVENAMRMVGVIGGYCFMMRREAFEKIRPVLETRNWFGSKVLDGEDREITNRLVLNGWGCVMPESAECYTNVPTTFKGFFNQWTRWRRTTLRNFFFNIRYMHKHTMKLGVGNLFVYVLTPLCLFISIIEIGLMFILDPAGWFDVNRAAVFVVSAVVVLWLTHLLTPKSTIKNPLRVIVYIAWFAANSLLLNPLALFTLDSGEWITRDAPKEKL